MDYCNVECKKKVAEPPAGTACNQESISRNPEDQHMLALSPNSDRRTLTWQDPARTQ